METLFTVLAPAPLSATAVPPADAAADPAATVASIVSSAVAVWVSVPSTSMLDCLIYACTSTGAAVPSFSYPIRFLASDAPRDAPAPREPTTADADAVNTSALMVEVFSASSVRFPPFTPALSRLLFSTQALVLVRITLTASAPAPLSATPYPATVTDADAAADVAEIKASSTAVRLIFPSVAETRLSASFIYAVTSLLI